MDNSISIPQKNIQSVANEENQAHDPSRRDFLKLAVILTGSAFLIANRFGSREEFQSPFYQGAPLILREGIPEGFKRFTITQGGPHLDLEEVKYVAYGAECPDLRCALLWVDQSEFQFYDDVKEIVDLYTQDGITELHWFD